MGRRGPPRRRARAEEETRTAEALDVHPNTLRYRVRNALALSGIGMATTRIRLVAMLQLRLAVNGEPIGKAPFPAL
ncbi:helix-turn-helix domain-containing protein [Streptomyces sp. NPDC033753]|uniref:helix-turn-helix domain-containing protein n=1 Tax=Streptomyces sp. NPDC033753 TaxID=3155128 RepID=UPI0033C6D644